MANRLERPSKFRRLYATRREALLDILRELRARDFRCGAAVQTAEDLEVQMILEREPRLQHPRHGHSGILARRLTSEIVARRDADDCARDVLDRNGPADDGDRRRSDRS